jgi:hypothetical protein
MRKGDMVGVCKGIKSKERARGVHEGAWHPVNRK